jgi:hypothetical protein
VLKKDDVVVIVGQWGYYYQRWLLPKYGNAKPISVKVL